MNSDIRLVVVDDHLIIRKGLRLMLEEGGKGFALLGEASNGEEAVRLVGELQPDVVLMDLRMPGMDGIEAIISIRYQWPQIAIVILTTYNEDDLMIRGLRAGACGYLLKDTGRETLFHAIRAAARGEMLIQPEIMARILTYTASAHSTSIISSLTEREREVLTAVVRGKRNKEIAASLYITESTVKAHLTSIYTKLGVDSRAAAVAMALSQPGNERVAK